MLGHLTINRQYGIIGQHTCREFHTRWCLADPRPNALYFGIPCSFADPHPLPRQTRFLLNGFFRFKKNRVLASSAVLAKPSAVQSSLCWSIDVAVGVQSSLCWSIDVAVGGRKRQYALQLKFSTVKISLGHRLPTKIFTIGNFSVKKK